MRDKTKQPQYNTFADAVGGAKFHPDIPQLPLKDCLDNQLLIKEATIIEDFNTKFGLSTFTLMLVTLPEMIVVDGDDSKGIGDTVYAPDTEFTVICSGEVVVKKLRKALDKQLLPLLGTITYNGTYYDIL